MWRQLFLDHAFWETIAIASTALLIAVALEVRTTREEMDQRDRAAEAPTEEDPMEATIREVAATTRTWMAKLETWTRSEEPDPRPVPEPIPIPDEASEDQERANQTDDRVANLLTSLWGLAVALVGSLIIASIAVFPGDVVAAIASLITLVAAGYGIWGLIWAISARILRS